MTNNEQAYKTCRYYYWHKCKKRIPHQDVDGGRDWCGDWAANVRLFAGPKPTLADCAGDDE